MVKVREEHPEHEDGSVDIVGWLQRLPEEAGSDPRLRQACEMSREAEQRAEHYDHPWGDTASGFRTGLEMVEILADLHLDSDSLIAAMLYRVVREEKLPIGEVEKQFGSAISTLIDGVLRMAIISQIKSSEHGVVLGQTEEQSDTVRKMLVSLVDDVRVALIKLAERTCAIRAVKNTPTKRYRVAKEVFDIYAPLAHRLGIGHIKWELEDLSFRYLEPTAYKKIAKLLDEKRLDRQSYIDQVLLTLNESLERAQIRGEVTGRAKHIYSIWRKMHRKGIGFSQVYDIRAVRILVPKLEDCYTVLGIVHGLWRNIPHEFDDYIANTKENGYQSLHTAVIGPEGKVLEVQIRTFDMHEEAEFGVCAHWRYKGTDNHRKGSSSYEEKIAWLRQVLDWHDETGEAAQVSEQFSSGQERVYVFTPKGHVVNLAHGSTPLDFAYHIHTEVGHRCRGAKVNGRIVPLTYTLQTGEQVEILTARDGTPRRDWLQPELGYVHGRARAKVQQWFKLQAREDNIAAGRALLEKSFRRLALTSLDYKAVAQKLHFHAVDDMYAAVGAGEVSARQAIHATQSLLEIPATVKPPISEPKSRGEGDVRIDGVGNLLTHMAKCCKPLPGDAIGGYITQGRGVSIHRDDCNKFLLLSDQEPERIVKVNWGEKKAMTYPVEIMLTAYDRSGLLADVTNTLMKERVNVLAMRTHSEQESHLATMQMTLEITGLDALGGVLGKLGGLPNVISAERVREGGE